MPFQDESLEFENQKSMRSFLLKKYMWELFFVLIVLTAIVFSAYMKFISSEVTGSLLGAVAGYSLGGLRKLHEGSGS